MNAIIERLKHEAHLTEDQAHKAYIVMINAIKEKVPFGFGDKVEAILNGNLDLGSMFGSKKEEPTASDQNTPPKSNNPLDKLNDFIKGL